MVITLLSLGLFTSAMVSSKTAPSGTYAEVAELSAKERSFKELSDYFRVLAQKRGGAYAFEVLKRMPSMPNVDMHLLGHIVGDELYKQEKIAGIKVCTADLRNACSHSIVIGALFEHGPSVLPEIADTCRKAPGGPGAYTMCYHGLGHGVLGYVDYEVPEAIELCKKTGTIEYRNREYVECVGGMVMEMIGGVHDVQLREEKAAKYLKTEDPLYPCSASFMPKEVQGICYTYLTPHLFEVAGGDLGRPTPPTFAKAFAYCDKISSREVANRLACYAGFGKEFVVLGAERDVRVVEELGDAELAKIASWCALAGHKEGSEACSNAVLSSLYWGGENKPTAAIRYCGLQKERAEEERCFNVLFSIARPYLKDAETRKSFCREIPTSRKSECTAYVSSRI